MDKQTAHRDWLVTGELTARRPGVGVVTVRLTNGRMGALPPMDIHVDWKPGMEPVDVVVFALGLIADGAKGLSDAAIAEAADLMVQGG